VCALLHVVSIAGGTSNAGRQRYAPAAGIKQVEIDNEKPLPIL
jgi:hypothetical protein